MTRRTSPRTSARGAAAGAGPTKPSKKAERLWLVCFDFEEPAVPGTRRPGGSYQMAVRARTPKAASDLCGARLRELRSTTSLFDTPCTIYLECIVALDEVGAKPAFLDFGGKHAMQLLERAVRREPAARLPALPPGRRRGRLR